MRSHLRAAHALLVIAASASGLASAVDLPTSKTTPPAGAVDVAIVLGSNASPSASVERLRYADDDAIQNARTLALLGARVDLLVTPDTETSELFGDVGRRGPATRAALTAAFERLPTAAPGRALRLYVFVAAHGDTDGDRPFLQLEDGRLFPEDLADLTRRANASETHVVIDACHATAFVASRGPGGERARLATGFSHGALGARWPRHTGFLTARSSGERTHEWSEYQGGIFSHEVRSGLLGGADLDLDGRVTYRELGAFVRRANQAVVNRKFRPDVVTAPPGERLDAVFATLPEGAPPRVLEIDGGPGGHLYVDDARGIRLADVHSPPGAHLRLRAPSARLFVHRGRAELRVPDGQDHVLLSRLTPEPEQARARGAAHEAFRQLFTLPLDRAQLDAFATDEALADSLGESENGPRSTPTKRWVRGSLGALGVAGVAAGVGLGLSAYDLRSQGEARDVDGETRAQINADVAARNRLALGVGAAGVALGATALLWWWLDRPR